MPPDLVAFDYVKDSNSWIQVLIPYWQYCIASKRPKTDGKVDRDRQIDLQKNIFVAILWHFTCCFWHHVCVELQEKKSLSLSVCFLNHAHRNVLFKQLSPQRLPCPGAGCLQRCQSKPWGSCWLWPGRCYTCEQRWRPGNTTLSCWIEATFCQSSVAQSEVLGRQSHACHLIP